MTRALIIAGLLSAVLPRFASADANWHRGSFHIGLVEPEVQLFEKGAAVPPVPTRFCDGIFSVSAGDGALLAALGSNGLGMVFEGPGRVSCERFDQLEFGADHPGSVVASPKEPSKSRLALSLESGLLLLDGRRLSDQSESTVLVPVGRLRVEAALCSIEVVHNERTTLYRFSVEVAAGRVVFTDRAGTAYTLNPGQRMIGSGTAIQQTVEVTDATTEFREQTEWYATEVQPIYSDLTFGAFAPHMALLRVVEPEAAVGPAPERARRGVWIEYAPRARMRIPKGGIALLPRGAEPGP